jgi:hypothetical protein
MLGVLSGLCSGHSKERAVELFFYTKLVTLLGRQLSEDEAALVRDLMGRLDSEININAFWKLLDWLATQGLKEAAETFATRLAGLVADRIKMTQGPWQKIMTAYGEYLAIKKLPNKGWVKWSLKSSDQYYQLASGISLQVLHTLPVLTVLGGEMSGDMFGIGASMILKPNMITVIKKTVDNPFDHTDQIKSFLTTCVKDESRVFVYEKRQKTVCWPDLEKTKHGDLIKSLRPPKTPDKASAPDEVRLLPMLAQIMLKKGQIFWVTPLDTGTKFLKERSLWEVDTPRVKIRHRWGVIPNDYLARAKKLETWLAGKNLPVQALRTAHGQKADKKVLILWSRFTGKKGEIHVEHDTSFRGIRQIALKALDDGAVDYVIITGDKPVAHDKLKLKPNQTLQDAKRARLAKFTTLCNDINTLRGRQCAFDLTAFWEDPASRKWTGGTRTGQFLLYEYLHRVCDARHLGMRSGNLEALALLGYWVRYMEETQSWGGERMEQWHDTALGYQRIIISAPPTRTGKYLIARVPKGTVHETPKDIKWLLNRRGDIPLPKAAWWPEEKPEEIEKGGQIQRKKRENGATTEETVEVGRFEKGFDKFDLYEIANQLKKKNLRKRLDTVLPT